MKSRFAIGGYGVRGSNFPPALLLPRQLAESTRESFSNMSEHSPLEMQYQQPNNDFEILGTTLDWNSILSTLGTVVPAASLPRAENNSQSASTTTPSRIETNPQFDWTFSASTPNPFDIFPFANISTTSTTPAESPFANWLSTDLALPSDDSSFAIDPFPLFPSSLSTTLSVHQDGSGAASESRGSRSAKTTSPADLDFEDQKTSEGGLGDEKDKRRRNTEASGQFCFIPFLLISFISGELKLTQLSIIAARFRAKKKVKNDQLESSTFELRSKVEGLEVVRDAVRLFIISFLAID